MLKSKRVFLSFVGLLFLSLFAVNFVSAYRFGFVGSIDSAIYQAQPVLSFFFGGYDYTGYMLFERILIFLLILSIVFVSLKGVAFFKGDENRKIVVLVSVIVSLLSVRYIDFVWLNTIMMTYQVFGIALTSLLPFLIYLFFLHGVSGSAAVRKIGWILFVCVYLGLYVTSDDVFYGQVYIWTMLAALIFLFFDKTISRAIMMNKAREAGKDNIWAIIREREDEKRKWLSAYGVPEEQKNKQVEKIDKDLKKLYKMVA